MNRVVLNEEFLVENSPELEMLKEADELLNQDAIDFEEWAFWHGFYGEI